MLGALFALSASPCAGVPLVSALVIIGVPIMTFGVAAPSRIGLLRELRLFWSDMESLVLGSLLRFVGRRRDAMRVRDRHRERAEVLYLGSATRIADAIVEDPLRFHHARRLAFFGTLLAVSAGMALPFVFPATYTFGDFPQAPFVILLDLAVFGLVGRVVAERVTMHLFLANHILRGGAPHMSRLRVLPLSILLGVALGAVGSLVVVSAGAMACAVETSWIEATNLIEPAFWFIRKTAPEGLPLGIAIGAILGAGMGLAQPPKGSLESHED
jgi:hypothetical protein